MDRRTALKLSLLTGSLWPARLLAQDPAERDPEPPRRGRPPARSPRPRPPAEADLDAAPPAADDGPPPNFPVDRGQSYRSWDITRYTNLPHGPNTAPQNALVEWIFRRTGSAIWHGDKVAMLCASRTQLRAYHSKKVLDQVNEMVERFTDAYADRLSIRVQFVAAVDTRWRYLNYSRLNPLGSGPEGQQFWALRLEDAAHVLAEMKIYQGFRTLSDRRYTMLNGQTLTVKTTDAVSYVAGPQRDSAIGLGVQPGTARLEEGIVLRLSPLLTYEGDALDAAVDLKATVVRKLHQTKILTRREIGPVDLSIDVPEVSETRLNQNIKGWKLGQTLLISAGIHPGILESKGGFLNLRIPGTVPTETELLVFLDVEAQSEPPRSARRGE
jgi:hypothetical protein